MNNDTSTRLKEIRARVEKQEGWITKGSAIFETNTCSGKILWPSQREAYIAGYGEGLASMLPEARFLLDLCDKQARALEKCKQSLEWYNKRTLTINYLRDDTGKEHTQDLTHIFNAPARDALTAIDEALK